MQRLRTAIILALAWCLYSTNRPAVAQQPWPTFSVEFRVTPSAVRTAPDIVLILKIGTHESRTSPIGEWGLAQYFDLWRDRAIEILRKNLHMASSRRVAQVSGLGTWDSMKPDTQVSLLSDGIAAGEPLEE